MTSELILAFLAYAFVTSITPGPNNTMLLASGLNFGFRASVPHMLGINLGFSALVLASGLGLGSVFLMFPVLQTVLKYVGAAYLLYLAWKIVNDSAPESDGREGKPMTFLQAAAFQWINPKAWIMAIGAIAAYTPANAVLGNLLLVTVIYALANGPCIMVWAAAGTALRNVLRNSLSRTIFNITMAALLVASLYPIFFAAE